MTPPTKQPVVRIALLLAAAASLMILTSSAALAGWEIGEPIVAYWNGPGTLLWGEHFGPLDDAAAQRLVEGGFNLALANSVQEVRVAQSHGLRTLFQSELLVTASLDNESQRPKLDAMIDALRQSPAHCAYMLKDEPNASEFADLGRLVDYLRKRDPDHLAYINLLPNYANNAQLGAEGYNAYLGQFLGTVHPQLLSYDHYQFTVSGDSPRYLSNLELAARAAKQSDLPFMNVVQACTWAPAEYRVPSESEMRFLIYTTLAYGAQGISYFQYTQADPPQLGGIMQRDGKPMPVYPVIQAGNREFVRVAKEYRSLKWIGTYLKGYNSSNLPLDTAQLPGSSPIDVANVSNTVAYQENQPLQGVLIGLFGPKDDSPADATVALIVNLDYSAGKTYTVTGPDNLSAFNAATGTWTATNRREAALELPPGGGVLVGVTSAVSIPARQK